jgi:signal transduction histidine kinase/ActR/RegA family two-component response regulator
MSADRAREGPGPGGESARLRRAFVVPTLVYPLWHLAAPRDATDPWIAWWLVAGSFSAVALLSRRVAFVERNLFACFLLCSWLVTLQLYVLAFVNDMRPFYAVGSVAAALATLLFIPTIPNLLAYSAFLFVLGGVLFLLEPDGRKLAYWGGVLPVAAGSYHRLALQLSAARITREHEAALERRVAERTAELSETNRRLVSEMEQRERLERELRFSQRLEAVGRLAGGVAHEFNNLLTTIRVFADLLRRSLPPGSPSLQEVGHIQRASRQASELTQRLLAFSRRSESKATLLDLPEAIAAARPVLELVCRLDARPQTIRANHGELEQVLLNLALNARDAMPGGGTLTLETRVLRASELPELEGAAPSGPEEYVLLAATDTGEGMDAETQAHAFDPFFTRKAPGAGTGLGLSMVYGVVRRAGGCVRLLSEPGRGARFELYWPRERGARAALEAHEPRPEPGGRGGRILVVEDQRDLRTALDRVLRAGGYTVVEVESAKAALEVAAREPGFDLVVTDAVMPRMNGLELIEALRAVRPETRILLVSGYLNHPSLRRAPLPAGITLLEKPFSLDELVSTVAAVLEAPPPAPARSPAPA